MTRGDLVYWAQDVVAIDKKQEELKRLKERLKTEGIKGYGFEYYYLGAHRLTGQKDVEMETVYQQILDIKFKAVEDELAARMKKLEETKP